MRGGGDRIKADVGEEHQSRASQNAGPPIGAPLACVGGNEGMPVRSINVAHSHKDDQKDDGQLERHNEVIDGCRFLNADDQDRGH